MKSLRTLALSALLSVGAFSAVLYTACNKDECKDVVCLNGGTCVSGTCSCKTGFEGSDCSTVVATKFVNAGGWRTTTEVCTVSGSNAQYDITVVVSGTDLTQLIINNLYDDGRNTTATITGSNSFVINSQSFGSSGTITGSGTLNGNQLTISYAVSVGAATDACNNVVFNKL